MSYTSLGYMLFVACCLIFYYIFPKKHRWWVLLAASIGFYAIVCLKYISFVFVTAASTYAGGRILEAYANKHKAYIKSQKGIWPKEERDLYKAKVSRRKKWITAAILLLNFGILGFLKYYNFFADALNVLLNPLGGGLPELGLFLPLGISFYTFQSMGYIIDIYREKFPAERNFGKMLLFTSFFPQIVQGPISFYSDLSGKLYEGHEISFSNIKQRYYHSEVNWPQTRQTIPRTICNTKSCSPKPFTNSTGSTQWPEWKSVQKQTKITQIRFGDTFPNEARY